MHPVNASVIRAAAVVFVASFCTLVIEIAAGRVLAPFVGVSLYTWTSIIGVVLAGISAGAWAGGWVADRRPYASTLSWLLAAAGATALLIAPATSWLAADDGLLTGAGIATTLLQRVVVLTFLLFFLPAFFLGMISPVAVKLALRDLESSGRIVGRIYAISTLGSIAGTYVTGFYLIARFGTRATLIGVGVVLIITAILAGISSRRGGVAVAAALALSGGAVIVLPADAPPPLQVDSLGSGEMGVIHEEESQYYSIVVERTVRDDSGAPVLALHLDHLVHSYSDPIDPSHLEYGYLQLFDDVARWTAGERPYPRLLFIGGGGYTLPRLLEQRHSDAEIQVVEIDPAVTRTAARFMGLPRATRIQTVNEDARWFAMQTDDTWNAIFIDAFNDLSVPYHLTTKEFTARLRAMLDQDGVLAANVIDDYNRGRFLSSYAATLMSVFGAENVAVLMESPADAETGSSTFVVVASPALPRLLTSVNAHALHGAPLQQFLRSRRAIVLTDDFVPVDNMLAPLFADRFVGE
jgi:predicted membrane-bound spermidine synthase